MFSLLAATLALVGMDYWFTLRRVKLFGKVGLERNKFVHVLMDKLGLEAALAISIVGVGAACAIVMNFWGVGWQAGYLGMRLQLALMQLESLPIEREILSKVGK